MKLYVDRKLKLTEEKIKLSAEFCAFAADHLRISGPFEVYMVSERKPHNITTTALYEVGNNRCRIYCKNRQLSDCLKSIAHEMTHMMQDQMGLLGGSIRDAGGFHEDQANSKAGEIIKLFAKSHPKRKRIYETLARSQSIVLK